MFARVLLMGFLAFIPALAVADTADQSTGAASSSLTPQVSGALLGPASSADASALQGASVNPLQSGVGSGSTLGATTGDALQASSTSDQLKVLIGSESDGAPTAVGDSNSLSNYPSLLLAGVIVLGLIGLVIFSRRRERLS